MLRPPRQLGQIIGGITAKLAWAAAFAAPFVTHWSLATGRHWPWAAGFAVVQIVMVGGMALRQATARWWAVPLMLVSCTVLLGRIVGPVMAGEGSAAEAGLVTGAALSHAALYLSLLALFGSTLRRGRTPLVTALAQRLRGPPSAAVISYTRGVTWLWCGYFVAQLLGSAALLLWAPVTTWSLFVNVLDAPLLLTVFAAEFAFRLWRLPQERHVSPLAIMRNFNRPATPADAG